MILENTHTHNISSDNSNSCEKDKHISGVRWRGSFMEKMGFGVGFDHGIKVGVFL